MRMKIVSLLERVVILEMAHLPIKVDDVLIWLEGVLGDFAGLEHEDGSSEVPVGLLCNPHGQF